MSAPWKKNKTTLEKVEERFFDIVDQLKLDERAAELKTQIKDMKLDERAAELKDQIASSDRLNELKDTSTVRLGDLKSQLSSAAVPAPKKKSHKSRKVLLLAAVGGAAAAIAYARKAASGNARPAPYSPPHPVTPPSTQPPTTGMSGKTPGAHADTD